MRCQLRTGYQLAERLLSAVFLRAGKGEVTALGRRLALPGKTVTFHLQFSTGHGGKSGWRRIGWATAGTETASLRVSFRGGGAGACPAVRELGWT
jgi:hypothetical protein